MTIGARVLGCLIAALLLTLRVQAVDAQTAPVPTVATSAPEITLPTVEIIGATPLLGSGIARDKVPAEATVLTSGDVGRDSTADMLGTLNQTAPGVQLSDTAGNPFQPALVYHGFQASPLQGNPQGLAVYVNGEIGRAS